MRYSIALGVLMAGLASIAASVAIPVFLMYVVYQLMIHAGMI